MNVHDVLPIRIDELSLRRVEFGDQADLLEFYGLAEVARFQTWQPWTVDQVENLIASQAEIHAGDPGVPFLLAIVLNSENKVIGDCQVTINSVPDRQGEIGYSLNLAYWGRGLATKAVNAALGFGFTVLGLHRIVAATDVRNQRSWRLLERVGMRREAHFRHDLLDDGEWIDDYLYAMLEDEWHAKNLAVDKSK